MASIRDVAKIAGVSPATVSRVMNGTANVDADKRQRVYEAIKQTGFVPNEVARSLYKKSAKLIGLIIPSITNPFFTELADSVEKAADKSGLSVVMIDRNMSSESTYTLITSDHYYGGRLAAECLIDSGCKQIAFGSNKVLKNAGFELNDGEVHALMGENGAGKSTLMKILTDVYTKDVGTVIVDGKEVSYKSPKEAENA